MLPIIFDAVLLCAKQQIAMRGHRDEKVNFTQDPDANEGNFLAILLLAEYNPVLRYPLVNGPKMPDT